MKKKRVIKKKLGKTASPRDFFKIFLSSRQIAPQKKWFFTIFRDFFRPYFWVIYGLEIFLTFQLAMLALITSPFQKRIEQMKECI